jgi:signal transduction histidine kinase
MRRRILLAIIAVTAVATTVLTIPLGVITAHRENDDSVRELERVAQRMVAELPDRITSDGDKIDLPVIETNVDLAVYLPSGARLVGSGPEQADHVTLGATRLAADGIDGSQRVFALPVVEGEHRVAVVRVAEPLGETTARVRRDVLVLLAFDLVAVGIAAAVGWFVASRLARPVRLIRDDAVRLGDGDFSIAPHRSGVAELDETAEALAETAGRLDAMLRRERAFSADASHQLRTPLAALRLSIETELLAPRPDPSTALTEAIGEIDRLEGTVTTLLDVARDRPTQRSRLDGGRLVRDLAARWDAALAERGRRLECRTSGPVSAHVSRPVLDQALDILVSNALNHGAGTVTVTVADEGDGLAVVVADEGRIDRDDRELFTRRDPGASGHGVGLSLARSLAEAEGGRLVLSARRPTTFRLVLPGSAAPSA